MLLAKLKPFPFDPTLTTQNAHARGYQWDIDVIRDMQENSTFQAYIQKQVKEEGYQLGQPWAEPSFTVLCGLYKPLAKPAQQNKV